MCLPFVLLDVLMLVVFFNGTSALEFFIWYPCLSFSLKLMDFENKKRLDMVGLALRFLGSNM